MIQFFRKLNKAALVSFFSVFALALAATAGSLTPGAAPASTMNTLEEIYESIAGTFDSSTVVADADGSLLENLKYIGENIVWASASGDAYYLGTGNVGIGTSTPGAVLNIESTASGPGLRLLQLHKSDLAAGDDVYFKIGKAQSFRNEADIYYYHDADGSSLNKLNFGFNGVGALMTLRADGNFGLGTSAPSTTLDVIGNASVSGTLEVGSCIGCGGVTSDSLDYDEFVDSMTLDANLTVASAGFTADWEPYFVSSLIPAANDTYDLGTSALRWRDLYLGPGTLYIGAAGDQASASYDTATNKLRFGINGAQSFMVDPTDFNTALGFETLVGDDAPGTYNVALGYQALRSNTSGTNNIAIGYRALYSHVADGHNVAIGGSAMFANTFGFENVAIGNGALTSQVTGSSNVAIGRAAMSASTGAGSTTAVGAFSLQNTTGGSNSAFGSYALNQNTTGFVNSALGYQSLFSNTTGSYNSAVGYSALFSNTTADVNAALGYQALYSNTTGRANAAFGYQSLYSNTTASNNSAFGSEALFSNTTGTDNIAIGASAGYNNTVSGNVFVGRSAGSTNTTGDLLTAVGLEALFSNTTGTGNTAVGAYSLRNNTDGYFIVAVGDYSLYSNTTGYSNTALGDYALYDNTSGGENVALGDVALANNTTASRNTALGHSALQNGATGMENTAAGWSAMLSGSNGSYNSAFGSRALYANTTGGYNAALGAHALRLNITGSDNVAVGASAGYSALGSGNVFLGRSAGYQETGSNTLWIDNASTASSSAFIYGELDNDWLKFGANVSISGSLEITGNTIFNGHLLPGADDTYDLGSSARRWRDLYLASGSLHIGTSGDEAVIDYNVNDDYLALKPDGSTATVRFYDSGTASLSGGLEIGGTASASKYLAQNGSLALPAFAFANDTDTGLYRSGANSPVIVAGGTMVFAVSTSLNNVYVGPGAGNLTMTGIDNTYLGYLAGAATTTGYQNTFLGDRAGASNTTGATNVFIGSLAGYSNESGNDSVYIGLQAGQSATGSQNVLIGRYAGLSLSSGILNTFIGTSAGQEQTGSGNTSLGSAAGRGSGNYNVSLGNEAGAGGTTGTRNIFLGSFSGGDVTAGINNILIGYNADVGVLPASISNSIVIAKNGIALASNQLVIGSYDGEAYITEGYFGSGVSTSASSLHDFRLNATGGWGTDVAGANLTLAGGKGTGAGAGGSLRFQTASAGTTGSSQNALTTRLTIDSTGLALFAQNVSVSGNFELSGTVSSNMTPTVTDTYDLGTSALRWRDLYLASGSLHIGTSGDEAIIDYNVNDDYLAFKPDGTSTMLTLTDAGLLELNGAASVSGTITSPGGYTNSERFGANSVISGTDASAFGNTASAGQFGVAIGTGAFARTSATAIGRVAIASGSVSIAVGSATQAEGARSIAIGDQAAVGASGTDSIALGTLAYTNGSLAVAIGRVALADSEGAAVGYTASASANGTAFGSRADAEIGTIAIGRGSYASVSNSFVAGDDLAAITSVYFGEGIRDATPLAYTINGTGGLGTDISGANMTLAGGRGTGSGAGGSLLFQTAAAGSTGTSQNSLTTRLTIDSTGLALFAQNVSVSGNFELSGFVSSNLSPTVTDTYDLGTSALRWRDLYLASGSLHIGTSGDEAVIDYNVNDDYLAFKPDGSTTGFVMTDGGNLGVGTTSPLYGLDVVTSTAGNVARFYNNNGGAAGASVFIEGGLNGEAHLYLGSPTTPQNGGIIYDNSINRLSFLADGGSIKAVIDSSGNLGIGDSTPTTTLDVNGNASISGNFEIGGNITAVVNISGTGYVGSGKYYADDGTALAPSYTFTGNTNIGMWRSGTQLGFNSDGTHMFTVGGTNIFQVHSTGATLHVGSMNVATGYQVGGTPGTSHNCATNEFLGDMTVTAGIVTAGSCETDDVDYAERFYEGESGIEAGDIVVADPDGPIDIGIPDAKFNQAVRKSDGAYQSSVLGVISTNPGLVIGSKGTAQHPAVEVALAGRVPVKVSTVNGAISVGDRIVASDISGVGMKATQPGMAVGIALEPTNLVASGSVQTVMLFIQPGYWVPNVEDAIAGADLDIETQYPDLFTLVISQFKSIFGIEFGEGSVKTDTIEAETLCVGTVCVTEEQFIDVFGSGIGAPASSDEPPAEEEPSDEPTTTPDPAADNGSSDEPLSEEPPAEEEPAPEGVSAPEEAPSDPEPAPDVPDSAPESSEPAT